MNSQATQLNSTSLDEAINLLQTTQTSFHTLSAEQLFGSLENVVQLIRYVQSSLKPNKVSFNQLSNEVLTLILRRISLQKLVNLRSVCSHWKTVIQPLFNERKSIKLLLDEELSSYCYDELKHMYPEHYDRMKLKPIGQDDDLLYQPSCSTRLRHCTILPRLFPNVVHLVAYVDYIYEAMPKLLSMLPGLIHLSLFGLYNWMTKDKLFTAINSLKSLKSLDFLIHHGLSPSESLAKLLPIARLEHLSIQAHYKDNFNDCLEIVVSLTPQCKYLGLLYPYFDTNFMQQLEKYNEKFVHLTHFTAQLFDSSSVQLLNFLRFFKNLNYLNIKLIALSTSFDQTVDLSYVFSRIAKHEHLQHLKISIPDIYLSDPPTTPLCTVKRLKVLSKCTVTTILDPPDWCQTFASFFPNLEQLTFTQTIESEIGDDQLKSLQDMLPRFKSYSTEADVADYMGRHKERYLNGLKDMENLEKWNQSYFSSESDSN